MRVAIVSALKVLPRELAPLEDRGRVWVRATASEGAGYEYMQGYMDDLTKVVTEAEIRRLNDLGDRLRDRLNAFFAERELAFCATGYGSLVGLHFTRGPVRSEADVPEAMDLRALLHLHMLERGFSYGRRGFIALSLPLHEGDIDRFAAAIEDYPLTA